MLMGSRPLLLFKVLAGHRGRTEKFKNCCFVECMDFSNAYNNDAPDSDPWIGGGIWSCFQKVKLRVE